MTALPAALRRQLEKTVLAARESAESGAGKALRALGVQHEEPPAHLTQPQHDLHEKLRAQAQVLGDRGALTHLIEKIAYDQWHRLLFSRFLVENELLIHPEHGVALSLHDLEDLAAEEGIREPWDLASRFTAALLPAIFRPGDPAGELTLPGEDRAELLRLLKELPADTFRADDALGWVYQFWQAHRKDEINAAEVKIGADELSPVTQLFTEDYMVLFLLHNTLGAWWTKKRMKDEGGRMKAETEADARAAVALPGVDWEYLRFIRVEDAPDTSSFIPHPSSFVPAAGAFPAWPQTARELRLLDPCMGSGHFLVAALPILAAMRVAEEGLTMREAVAAVLRENLFGLELDPRCAQIAGFNLTLAAWKLGGWQPGLRGNLAISGLGIHAPERDWLALAGEKESGHAPGRLGEGMSQLYRVFSQAPLLGSLIEPRAAVRTGGDLLTAEFHELQPLLAAALDREQAGHDAPGTELAVTAQGLARAAGLLAGRYHLVATNVPYLGRGKQEEALKDFCQRQHPDAKADLATCFVERCLSFCEKGGTTVLVTPQTWLFLGTFKKLRNRLLLNAEWNAVVKLGANAFHDMNWWAATTLMLALSNRTAEPDHLFLGVDSTDAHLPEDKATRLSTKDFVRVSQQAQFANPDSRIGLERRAEHSLLETFGLAYSGQRTGDFPRFGRVFWEQPKLGEGWVHYSGTVEQTEDFGGNEYVMLWEDGRGQLAAYQAALAKAAYASGGWKQGWQAWGKLGVRVSQMGGLPVSLHLGTQFDNNCAVIVPSDPQHLAAIWSFCSSEQFGPEVRKIDQALKVTNASLCKIPFDLAHWQQEAAERYPAGLPKPHSDDPTQWLFAGHPQGALAPPPIGAAAPLHVAVARLLGYRWPRLSGSAFPDCPALGPDGLEPHADADGIVCLNAIQGEAPAAERLHALLAAAYGTEWSAEQLAALLAPSGAKSLSHWLRDHFFEEHCTLFHHRPFLWQVWDGRKDGFSALVHYHRLDRAALEKLTYATLGDWLRRQQAAVEAGEPASDARLAAARELQAKLKLILEGEPPHDLFIRWKPLAKQPLGWEPDLNDGVRLNLRPFITAGILRKPPKVHWNKDRGKDVPSAPWFETFGGDRINDHHLTLAEKRAGRENNTKMAEK